MPSNPPRIYFDACVFLAYVSGEADRAPTIELLFEKSEAGEIDIVTSTTSITEVTYVLGEQEAEKLDPDIESKLDNLLGDVKTVVLAEFSSLVARDALYAHAWALEPEASRGYAANLGLELERFERDLAGGAVLRRVREQRVSGHHLGVDATPTLFINSVRYTGALRSGALEGAIEGQR